MRYFLLVIISIALVAFFGCSGKTTVKEELVDTSPKSDSATVDEATPAPAEQTPQAAGEEQPKTDESGGTTEENNGDRRLAPGEEPPEASPSDTTPRDGKTEPEAKTDRDAYMTQKLTYPGSQPVDNAGMMGGMGAGNSAKSFVTTDPPEKVVQWFKAQFGDKAQENLTGSQQKQDYRIVIKDTDSGYTSNIVVSKSGSENSTLILIKLSDS